MSVANGKHEEITGVFWYKNNEIHREDGPAIERMNGTKEWWVNGQLHREDGPAIEYPGGYKAWYIKNKQMTEEEFNQHVNSFRISKNKM